MSTKLKAGTATSGAVIDADTTGILELQSGSTPTTAVTIDASQNVGIGTASPSTKLQISAAASTNNTSRFVAKFTDTSAVATGNGGGIMFQGVYTGTTAVDCSGIQAYKENATDGNYAYAMTFATRANGGDLTERMRIDSSGNVLINTASTVSSGKVNIVNNDVQLTLRQSAATAGKYWNIGPFNSSSTLIVYNQNNTGVYITDGGTSWSANSDERIKDIIEPITNATEKVSSLRAVIGKYKHDTEETRRSFLIAQDVQKVLPEAINVQDDEQGTLGLQYTDVIPLLVASIKELKQELDATKAEVAALKGTK